MKKKSNNSSQNGGSRSCFSFRQKKSKTSSKQFLWLESERIEGSENTIKVYSNH